MTEILFRGKRVDNGEWVYGLLARYNQNFEVANISHNDILVPIETKTVGQYTGLDDKNGKKIYEGDIVKTERDLWHGETKKEREVFVSVVKYDDNSCSFGLCGKYNHLTLQRFKDCFDEVIGNIHENPELLKGGEGEK